jgi:hypothetical protein
LWTEGGVVLWVEKAGAETGSSAESVTLAKRVDEEGRRGARELLRAAAWVVIRHGRRRLGLGSWYCRINETVSRLGAIVSHAEQDDAANEPNDVIFGGSRESIRDFV